MEQILIKTEMQPDGNILLFYVDENHEADPCLLQQEHDVNLQPETKYIIEDNGEGESADELDIAQATEQVIQEKWLDEEVNRLIVFYNDNKKNFLNSATKNKHLWAVACRTMLTGRNPITCEAKLRLLKTKYIHLSLEKQKGIHNYWPYYDICHQAFYDDSDVQANINVNTQDNIVINVPVTNIVNEDGVIVVKKVNSYIDEKVQDMLSLYIKHKNTFGKHNLPKNIWDTIALELGQESADYWHKRFLNFKQHYIRILYKKKEFGTDSINWPYMHYFDQIFNDDADFQQRFPLNESDNINGSNAGKEQQQNIWYTVEQTFLAKYYFDCFYEFQDPTIPDNFLWHEVGRLLNKIPEKCKEKFNELNQDHLKILMDGSYDLSDRVPLEILLDNIIARETEMVIMKIPKNLMTNDTWSTEQLDELVQYLYDNMIMLKDSICYYVCWAIISKKLKRTILSCVKQWNDLKKLYKSILNDKKENPDMHIDWRYIDIFDRIFDYGMDTNLLFGYENLKHSQQVAGKFGVKKITFKDTDENIFEDKESYDERGFIKHTKKHTGDEKAFKLLEYYHKNKDKFLSSHHKKLSLWEALGKQIGVSASECAHRFRNFKQVYTAYVQREVNKPEMPILWPYYSLCKKVFGYRAIKSKLKNGKMDNDDVEDWSAKEIKQVINHLSNNFSKIINNTDDDTVWIDLAQEMGRAPANLREKFLELRKSYRKLKTMKTRNPDVKVSWKYFNMMDNIYTESMKAQHNDQMDVDDNQSFEIVGKTEPQDDDDFQCIIVIPEGEDLYYNGVSLPQESNQQVSESTTETQPRMFKWNRQSKRLLLKLYINYLKLNTGKEINPIEMWTEIASGLGDKTRLACRNMFLKLRRNYNTVYGKPYSKLIRKIIDLKSKTKRKNLDEYNQVVEDVPMVEEKVLKALNYYLQNLEDFVSPKFDKSYLWNELAKHVMEPVGAVYSKINYLKNNYNKDLQFQDILQEILVQENELKYEINKQENLSTEDASEDVWTALETERLLTWYLAHLDQFKNPTLIRSSLWMEASDILKKSPIICSKKMTEIRYQYRSMVKENPEGLEQWRFYNLCQRIYGTGKKVISNT